MCIASDDYAIKSNSTVIHKLVYNTTKLILLVLVTRLVLKKNFDHYTTISYALYTIEMYRHSAYFDYTWVRPKKQTEVSPSLY